MRPHFVYVAQIERSGHVKVGMSAGVRGRLATLRSQQKSPVQLRFAGRVTDKVYAHAIEQVAHIFLSPFRVAPEIYAIDPAAAYLAVKRAARQMRFEMHPCSVWNALNWGRS